MWKIERTCVSVCMSERKKNCCEISNVRLQWCNLIGTNAFGTRSFRIIKFNEAELAQSIELAVCTAYEKVQHQVLYVCFCV